MSMLDLRHDERQIIAALLDDAAAAGLLVSVYDGEWWAVKPTHDQTAIRLHVGATCETTLRFRNPAKLDERAQAGVVGSVYLVHGNGCDVISDYSDNPATAALVARASGIAERVSL